MLDLLTYDTASAKARREARRPPAMRARWLEISWYGVAGLGVLGFLIAALGAVNDYREAEALLLLLCAPLAALVPVTIGIGLRRSARIERALDELVKASARPAEARPDTP